MSFFFLPVVEGEMKNQKSKPIDRRNLTCLGRDRKLAGEGARGGASGTVSRSCSRDGVACGGSDALGGGRDASSTSSASKAILLKSERRKKSESSLLLKSESSSKKN